MAARALFAAVLFLMGLGGAPLHAACRGGPSKFFTVSGQVKNPTSFDLRKLQQFAPQAHVKWGTMDDILRKVVVVTGTDCYQTVFSAGELDPSFGRSTTSREPITW